MSRTLTELGGTYQVLRHVSYASSRRMLNELAAEMQDGAQHIVDTFLSSVREDGRADDARISKPL